MDNMDQRDNLVKLNIKKLKVLCSNMGIKFKSKWKKSQYIEEIEKRLQEEEASLSLGKLPKGDDRHDPEKNTLLDENENTNVDVFNDCEKCKDGECLCKRKASTPISKTSKRQKAALLLGSGIHKYFQELCGMDAPQPDEISNWTKDPHPSVIPYITSVEVYNYLVQQKSIIDKNSNKHFKGFEKSVAHHDAKDIVGGLETSLIYDQFLYIKSRCYPSMKPESYRVVAVVDSLDRTICGGACECTIGLSGACSHVGALLLYVETYAKMGDDEFQVSCTSKPCAWNAPKSRKVVSKMLTEISFNKPRLYTEKCKAPKGFDTMVYSKFDPRHQEDRIRDPDRLKKAILYLKNIHPKTGASHFWDLEGDSEMNIEDVEKDCLVQEYELDGNQSCILQKCIYKPAMIYRDVDESLRQQFVASQVISQEIVDLIEAKTKEQSANDLWKEMRRGRITSSLFGRILVCKEKQFPTSLVDTILNPSKLDRYARLPRAMLRGQKLEPIARQAYEKMFNVTVEASGFSLMAEHSFIGASGDGLITDLTETTKGILEIKCPCSVRGTDITKMKISTIVDSFPSFCLKKVNGAIILDRKSPYYAQVQGEMAVKKLNWADFVVYNEAPEGGLYRERILFDQTFWQTKLLPKCRHFFTKYITPFLISELE